MSANLLEDLVSLANGCVCYPVRKNITRVLAELDRRAFVHRKPFDGVFAFTFLRTPLDSVALQDR